jgi:hypothetical protein
MLISCPLWMFVPPAVEPGSILLESEHALALVDAYPVVVITGFKTLLGFGPKISAAVDGKPDGLLLHEDILFSLRHFGMRQYWRDFESLEVWSRSDPHRQWWQDFCATAAAPGSGMKRISGAAVSK